MSRRLVRKTRSAMLAGVAAGFADYFDLDPVLVRLGFVLLCVFGGSGLLLYVISWILMPPDTDVAWAPGGSAPPPGGEPATGVAGEPHGGGTANGGKAEEFARKATAAGEEFARRASEVGERVAHEAGAAGERLAAGVRQHHGGGRLVAGVILIALGGIFLLDQLLPWNWWWIGRLWPLALIAVGVAIVVGASRGDRR